jgi:DNA-binding winged helix-turn-helix (wHTH) protein/Tfp pilus assembly protein PilF
MNARPDNLPEHAGRASPIRLGRAEFDAVAMRLLVDGQEVPLEPRPMALLGLLVSRRGEMVTKATIFEALWSNRAVTESSLTKCVARLRSALGDDGHTLIRTVHGAGYRLDVEDAPASLPPAKPGPEPQTIARVPSLSQLADEPAPQDRPRRPWAARAGALVLVGVLFALIHKPVANRPVPPAATALYLKGMQDWALRTPTTLARAVGEFTAALRIAPDYAEAHAGLAFCYNLLPEYAAMPSAQAFPLARAEAERAIKLKPDLAAAHAAYAFALFWGDWAFADALREYSTALRLEPGNATVHHWYANSLDIAGRHDQALAEIDRALELDPGSVSIKADRGLILFHAGRQGEARDVLTALEASAPDFLSPHAYLATMALTAGDSATYLREWSLQARLQHNAPAEAIVRAAQAGLQSGGEPGMRRALLEARLAAFADGAIPATDVACSYALLGDAGRAVDYLHLAIDRHDPAVIAILNGPEFRPLMGYPGIGPVLARLQVTPPIGF